MCGGGCAAPRPQPASAVANVGASASADRSLRDCREAATALDHATYRVFRRAMPERGVYFHRMQLECWYGSGADAQSDVEVTLGAAAEALALTGSAPARP